MIAKIRLGVKYSAGSNVLAYHGQSVKFGQKSIITMSLVSKQFYHSLFFEANTKMYNFWERCRQLNQGVIGVLGVIGGPGACTVKHYGFIIYGKLTYFIIS